MPEAKLGREGRRVATQVNNIIRVIRETNEARMQHCRETGERLGVSPPCNLDCSALNEPSQELEFVLQRSKTNSRVTRRADAQPLACSQRWKKEPDT
jgi:hypothetical protein